MTKDYYKSKKYRWKSRKGEVILKVWIVTVAVAYERGLTQ